MIKKLKAAIGIVNTIVTRILYGKMSIRRMKKNLRALGQGICEKILLLRK